MGFGHAVRQPGKTHGQGLVQRPPADQQRTITRHYYRMTTLAPGFSPPRSCGLESVVREAKLRLRGVRPKEAL